MMRIRIGWIILMLLAAPLIVSAQSKPLPETYVSGDKNLTFRYPSGWVIQSDIPGQFVVATDESLFDVSEEIPSGQAAFGILFLDSTNYFSELVTGEDPISLLNSLVKLLFEEAKPETEFGTP